MPSTSTANQPETSTENQAGVSCEVAATVPDQCQSAQAGNTHLNVHATHCIPETSAAKQERAVGADCEAVAKLWIYSMDTIRNRTPSRADGIDFENERRLRISAAKFLTELAQSLCHEASIIAIDTGKVFLHRFLMMKSLATRSSSNRIPYHKVRVPFSHHFALHFPLYSPLLCAAGRIDVPIRGLQVGREPPLYERVHLGMELTSSRPCHTGISDWEVCSFRKEQSPGREGKAVGKVQRAEELDGGGGECRLSGLCCCLLPQFFVSLC